MNGEKIVILSGGFDPVHSGHIEMIEHAQEIGRVVIAVNSDEWLERKKGKCFMPFAERVKILDQFKNILMVIGFDDRDGTAKDAIRKTRKLFPKSTIVFANGGDRNSNNIPEMEYEDDNLLFEFGIGGTNKANSSSKILAEWKSPKTERSWGYYRVLHSDGPETKVKELTVAPGNRLSLQKHKDRKELWMVSYGDAIVLSGKDLDSLEIFELKKHDQLYIDYNEWHQLQNNTEKELRIVEIQYGRNCIEEDIIRINSSKEANSQGDEDGN